MRGGHAEKFTGVWSSLFACARLAQKRAWAADGGESELQAGGIEWAKGGESETCPAVRGGRVNLITPWQAPASSLSDFRAIPLVFLNFRPSNLSDPSEKLPHKRFCGVGFLKNLSARQAASITTLS